MMKIVYSLQTGEITATYSHQVIIGPVGEHEGIAFADSAEIGLNYVDVTTGEVLQRNAADVPAGWRIIRAKRDELEVSPITLDSGMTFDYDQQAKLRFETALSQFDNLPTLVDGKLAWKLADNSFELHTKTELQSVYDELQQKTAIRASLLFSKAEELAAGSPTVGDLEDLATWGL